MPGMVLFVALLQQPPALNATLQSDFTYLASTRTTTAEYWIAADRSYEKLRDRVRVERFDAAAKPEAQAQAAPDLRMAGYDYEPEFTWEVKETGETQLFHGRTCRLTTAAGLADYAETSLRLWFCPAQDTALERRLSGMFPRVMALRYAGISGFILKQAASRPDQLLVQVEETTEPPIAPAMVRKARIVKLETAPAPAGIFEPPAESKKAQ